ncbi:MAG: UDP-N-acetylmuramate:L-alanyl-gamma-D-glutamyl-meso-diaminopimelate ligase [Burkholderiales bacterium]
MHLHILGICGTFMGGLAAIAKQQGHKVTGCDANVYPPMSTQLEAQGIALTEGFAPEQTNVRPDVFVIGNVVTRGNPLMEEILNRQLPYVSGPQWLYENVLRDAWVLGVAGTHGKTTTSAMLAWILEHAGLTPGFLIGGVLQNFGVSARLNPPAYSVRAPFLQRGDRGNFFVVEADEYDTAFFDKRSKFVHYHPKTLILNNLEFDHADIFADLAAIETQFHHMVRVVAKNGLLVVNAEDESLQRVLDKDCWTPIERFGPNGDWRVGKVKEGESFEVIYKDESKGSVQSSMMGEHNRLNALAAVAAARHVGVPISSGIAALQTFENVKRRMEVRGQTKGVTVYDDFAHHPTAIARTLAGLRAKVGDARILAVLEPRSNTMKMGVWKSELGESLRGADLVFGYTANLGWDADEVFGLLGAKSTTADDLNALIKSIRAVARPGDHVLIMSNGGFGGIHEKLLKALAR